MSDTSDRRLTAGTKRVRFMNDQVKKAYTIKPVVEELQILHSNNAGPSLFGGNKLEKMNKAQFVVKAGSSAGNELGKMNQVQLVVKAGSSAGNEVRKMHKMQPVVRTGSSAGNELQKMYKMQPVVRAGSSAGNKLRKMHKIQHVVRTVSSAGNELEKMLEVQPVLKFANTKFKHLFDPRLLTGDQFLNVDSMRLDIQCLECLIKAPITSMYRHTAEVHSRSLCVYCLETFEQKDELQTHLYKKHNVPLINCSSFTEFKKLYPTKDIELFCNDCKEPILDVNEREELESAVLSHKCNVLGALCPKCQREYPFRIIENHVKNCKETPPVKVKSMLQIPLSMIKKEPIEIDLVSSDEESSSK